MVAKWGFLMVAKWGFLMVAKWGFLGYISNIWNIIADTSKNR